VSDPLRAAAQARPDAPALDDGERVWTYAELDAAVGRMARRLAPLGAGPGSTVALVAHPNPVSVQAVWAVPRNGAVLVPLNPRLGAAAMERALDTIGPDLILGTEEDVREAALDSDWVTPLDDLPKPADAAPEDVTHEARLRRFGGQGPSLRDELAEVVREDPDAAAGILRGWINAAG